MALIVNPLGWLSGAQAIDIADQLRRQAETSGMPPAVDHLGQRPRAAFDRVVDALNRLPRPVSALGTLALLGAAVVAPDWFSDRMEALARMPEGLWWLIGAVLSLHFGARVQAHAQEFQREILASATAPRPVASLRADSPSAAEPGGDAALTLGTLAPAANAALADWQRVRA
ncbi:3TM-type holin [Rubellimicrobium arenae]|uniref:3TM-type holin n=1 Tax=Rubellimicrobium arenae TaxID=2817372 RepID=UPI001B30A6CC|nr:3TM-type holin [Rubellimicrobium arenae]